MYFSDCATCPPESADAVIARDSSVFVADKLSNQNKAQLKQLNVEWVELRNSAGFKRFKIVLENLGIPHSTLVDIDIDKRMDEIFDEIFV